ncbi:transporter substrate-binding domain-containing protein, partial [Desulfobacterales bacterium HSG17]|nr:transporter substrate-binding domain-containing protein [Desulfobacterales bacterium HSG17]
SLYFICAAFGGDLLVITGESFPPYKYVEKGQIKGIDAEVAKYIFDKLGVKYTIDIMPWARCWSNLQNGNADVGLAVSKKLKREKFVYYPENHVWDASFVFLTNTETKTKYEINNMDDIKKHNLKIGVIKGNSYHEVFWKAFPWQNEQKTIYNPQLRVLDKVQTCLSILDKNIINLYPIPKTIGLYTVKEMNLKNITNYDFVIFSKPYPNVFSKASKFANEKFNNITELMNAYDEELGKFKSTPEFTTLFEKYEK